jgi:adenylosuccinate lyase
VIERYQREKMASIWSERNRYLLWLKVEHEVCRALASEKKIPASSWKALDRSLSRLASAGGVDPRRVNHFEKTLKHDVISFTTAVAEKIGPEARYVHFGLTSSDVVDSAFALQLKEASEEVKKGLLQLLQELLKKARAYQKTPTIGRSHGIFAEPTSFGLKFLSFASECLRNLERLDRATEGVEYGKLSGAVGVNAHFSPQFEARVLKKLGLKREWVSTQVVPRDRVAELMSALALTAGMIERICIEFRHLQRTEVGELREGFAKGQKGSSAMPHKRNPISSENLTGCARMIRAYAQPSLENIALWHERDISHSATERVMVADAFILLDYMLSRLAGVVDRLEIQKDRIASNLKNAGGVVFSGHLLLALVEEGAPREEAYRWVQECALAELDGRGVFIDSASKHPEIARRLNAQQLKKLGSMKYQLRNVAEIYREFSHCVRRKRKK